MKTGCCLARHACVAVLSSLILFGATIPSPAQESALVSGAAFVQGIKSPEAFLGYPPGSRPARYADVVAYLTYVAGWPVLALGLLSIAAAYLYTGGPRPYGYLGLGDLAVFLFFGIGAVAGTYYVQALSVSRLALIASIPIGALATAILVVNNLRDIETDARAGKHTLAVRIGERATRAYYFALLLVAYVVPLLLWWRGLAGPHALLPWLSLPLALRLASRLRHERGLALNGCLVRTARLEVVFGLLFALGLAW